MNTYGQGAKLGGQAQYELMQQAFAEPYCERPQRTLYGHFFLPAAFDATSHLYPVIAFYHGGLWDHAMPWQLAPYALHFARRGAVTACFDYRVATQDGTGPLEALDDVRQALMFLRRRADEGGFDPNRLAVVGAGSGAQLALSALLEGQQARDAEQKKRKKSKNADPLPPDPRCHLRPDALILLSPVLDTSSRGGLGSELFPDEQAALKASPLHQLPQRGLPPCLHLHSTGDRLIEVGLARKFQKLYQKKGNQAELLEFAGASHTFFNYHPNSEHYEMLVRAIDGFLTKHKFLLPNELDF